MPVDLRDRVMVMRLADCNRDTGVTCDRESLRCGRQTPTVLAWLAPSIIGTGVMPCAIITIAAYGKFSCPVLVQVSYSSSRASKARSSRDSESQHSVHQRPF